MIKTLAKKPQLYNVVKNHIWSMEEDFHLLFVQANISPFYTIGTIYFKTGLLLCENKTEDPSVQDIQKGYVII